MCAGDVRCVCVEAVAALCSEPLDETGPGPADFTQRSAHRVTLLPVPLATPLAPSITHAQDTKGVNNDREKSETIDSERQQASSAVQQQRTRTGTLDRDERVPSGRGRGDGRVPPLLLATCHALTHTLTRRGSNHAVLAPCDAGAVTLVH